ncbi:MAG: oxalate:formate antiporter [Chlorobaculum sp.]|nr:oxalate:formate antiporter [Chlorobaculum sp.]
MSNHIDGSRNSCALHGALQLIEAIDGVVPVVHSNAGCGFHHFLGVNRASGSGVACGSPPLSSSNVTEKHVVFGGSSRLREQLKNTVKVVDGDLYFIVSGCSTEMVGDDIPAMTKEGREQSFPVVFANTPGFRGGVHHGYQLATKALIDQLPELRKNHPAPSGKLVNVWGIVPRQDPFWAGNLEEIGRLLEGIGLEPNLLLGNGQEIDGWHRVPQAALNLVLSFWGEAPAQRLAELYGTPSIVFDAVPTGSAAGKLLRDVAERLDLDPELAEPFIQNEEARLHRHLAALADTYFRAGFQREFVLVGESAQVVGIGNFLVRTLGLIPRGFVITDDLPDEQGEVLRHTFGDVVREFGAQLFFSEDCAEIAEIVRELKPGLVLGSALEAAVAREIGALLLKVSFPLGDRVVLDRAYAGYRGAATLIEDLGSVLLPGS